MEILEVQTKLSRLNRELEFKQKLLKVKMNLPINHGGGANTMYKYARPLIKISHIVKQTPHSEPQTAENQRAAILKHKVKTFGLYLRNGIDGQD